MNIFLVSKAIFDGVCGGVRDGVCPCRLCGQARRGRRKKSFDRTPRSPSWGGSAFAEAAPQRKDVEAEADCEVDQVEGEVAVAWTRGVAQ